MWNGFDLRVYFAFGGGRDFADEEVRMGGRVNGERMAEAAEGRGLGQLEGCVG